VQGLCWVFRLFRAYEHVYSSTRIHAPAFARITSSPTRVHREYPEHPAQALRRAASSCSGYPEHSPQTRNIPAGTRNNVVRYAMSQPQKPLRQAMPRVAEFLDACAAAWGGQAISAIIRAGLDGQPVFHASEGGHEIGTRMQPPAASYPADVLLAGSHRIAAAACARGRSKESQA